MLTFADICCHLQTIADIYADIYTRPHVSVYDALNTTPQPNVYEALSY